MKIYFGVLSLLVFFISNCYFGWNLRAQSDAERWCDSIYIILGVCFWLYKPTQKEWYYHVSFSITNNGKCYNGESVVHRNHKVTIGSSFDAFKEFCLNDISNYSDENKNNIVILSWQEIPPK